MLDEAEYGYENMDESDEEDLYEDAEGSPSKNKKKRPLHGARSCSAHASEQIQTATGGPLLSSQ